MTRITTEVTSDDDPNVSLAISLIIQDGPKCELKDKHHLTISVYDNPDFGTMGSFSIANVEAIIDTLNSFLLRMKSEVKP